MQRSNWKKFAGSLVLASAVAVPGITLAGDHGNHHGKGHHHQEMFDRMADKLELTEGQRAQLEANREAGREKRRELRKEMHELRSQVREALDSGADQATLDSLAAKLGALEIKKMQQRHERHEQFQAILTDEQKAKLEQMHSERKERWKERRKQRTDSE
ncbi:MULTISPECIES: Spy/CpxP family protein refolding chaperone [Microbulbifer]|uniref:Spy/CpxP family protein refolding chaperone n=1 Tax=Microbulbifer TaxID=48073 RepID=UPI001E442C24|nr:MULTISPECIES: Spy/CpxP family protein refolding chaperone [Microbulbifer]UHQ55099.1 Spy/CpxP family protein refolding chaperone [Microbulbifer sp. YPW16]